MKILLDPQIFHTQRFGGISRYFAEVLFWAPKIDKTITIKCPLPYHNNFHLQERKMLKPTFFQRKLRNASFKGSFRLRKRFSEYKRNTLSELGKQKFDLFVATYYNPYFLGKVGERPFVLTVYDMIHEIFPHCFQQSDETSTRKKMLMEKATVIIAISNSTKKDILRLYPHIPEQKVKVVHLAQSINITAIDKKVNGLPEKYILYIGNRSEYKNFHFFIKAIMPLLLKDRQLYVVCAGGEKLDQEGLGDIALLEDLGIASQVIQQNFADDELAGYYRHAAVFVFPSLYEGFGIPVLEAMTCGCPVVLSAHSSFPEVAGNAGVYFEQGDAHDLLQKIEGILKDPILKAQYISAGYEQVKKFSWQKTVSECLAIYKQVINEEK